MGWNFRVQLLIIMSYVRSDVIRLSSKPIWNIPQNQLIFSVSRRHCIGIDCYLVTGRNKLTHVGLCTCSHGPCVFCGHLMTDLFYIRASLVVTKQTCAHCTVWTLQCTNVRQEVHCHSNDSIFMNWFCKRWSGWIINGKINFIIFIVIFVK